MQIIADLKQKIEDKEREIQTLTEFTPEEPAIGNQVIENQEPKGIFDFPIEVISLITLSMVGTLNQATITLLFTTFTCEYITKQNLEPSDIADLFIKVICKIQLHITQ